MRRYRKTLYAILFLAAFAVAASAVWLPGYVLEKKSGAELGGICPVPADYIVAEQSAMARNASAQYSTYDKLRLISGVWKSEIVPADNREMEINPSGAAVLAKERLAELCKDKRYPVDFAASYKNWYHFEAVPYKAVDSVFHSYAAYFWEITFEKYDRTEIHTVRITEDGTVFFAEAKKEDNSGWDLQGKSGTTEDEDKNLYEWEILNHSNLFSYHLNPVSEK